MSKTREPNLTLRGTIYYVRLMRDKKLVYQSTGTDDLRLARKVRDRIKTQLWEGTHVDKPASLTIQEVFDKALVLHYHTHGSLSTVHTNFKIASGIIGVNTPISEITSNHYLRIIQVMRAAGSKDGTINRKLCAISTLLSLAKKWGDLRDAPAVPLQVESRGRIRSYSQQEEQSILIDLSTHDKDMEALVAFLVDSGARLSEALNLKQEDIDFTYSVVHLWNTKGKGGGKMRSIPMTERVLAILGGRSALPKPFPITKDTAEHKWSQSRTRLGKDHDKEWVMHTLRHTCCTRLIKKNISLVKVQLWMGHEDIQTTRRYAHVNTEDLRECAAALDEHKALHQICTNSVADIRGGFVGPLKVII